MLPQERVKDPGWSFSPKCVTATVLTGTVLPNPRGMGGGERLGERGGREELRDCVGVGVGGRAKSSQKTVIIPHRAIQLK